MDPGSRRLTDHQHARGLRNTQDGPRPQGQVIGAKRAGFRPGAQGIKAVGHRSKPRQQSVDEGGNRPARHVMDMLVEQG